MADVAKLIRVLHRLVDSGNSVIVIEHNLELMAEADWIIDIGPEGGEGGGRVVAKGSPEKVAASKRSQTAPFLKDVMERVNEPKKVKRVTKKTATTVATDIKKKSSKKKSSTKNQTGKKKQTKKASSRKSKLNA